MMIVFHKKLMSFLLVSTLIGGIYSQFLYADHIFEHYASTHVSKDFLKNKKVRTYLQDVFITEYLFNWMDNHGGIFPSSKNFGEKSNQIHISFYKLFNTESNGRVYLGLFDSKNDLIEQAMKKAKKLKKYHFYTFPPLEDETATPAPTNAHIEYINSIDLSDLRNPSYRKKIQKYFIKNIIFPWAAAHNGKFPVVSDYKKAVLGISYTRAFGLKQDGIPYIVGIFDTPTALKLIACNLDKDHKFISVDIDDIEVKNPHVAYLRTFKPKDLTNPAKKAELQRYFIENVLFPWIIAHNGRYPKLSEFRRNGVGISYSKLFGSKYYKKRHTIGLFNSALELKDMVYSLAQSNPNIPQDIVLSLNERVLFSDLLKTLDYTNPQEVDEHRYIFVTRFVLPWIDTHKKFPDRYAFKTADGYIGFSYERIFGTGHYKDPSYPTLFKSFDDFKRFVKLLIDKYEIDPSYEKYLNPCENLFSE